jgi:N6-adenosine-specific RNA methylase IME4
VADIERYAMTGQLETLQQARELLELAGSPQEARRVVQFAEAMRHVARQADMGLDAQNEAAELKLRAQRRLGEMLAGMDLKAGRPQETVTLGDRFLLQDLAGEFEISLTAAKNLSANYQALARIPEDLFDTKIAELRMMRKELTTSALVRYAKLLRTTEDVADIPLPPGKFVTIEADPPWNLAFGAPKGPFGKYPTMELEAIKEMGEKVLARAADNAHLYLWAVSSMLPEAFEVMEAWGFTYRTVITWYKTNGFGMGHHYRSQTEQVLFGVLGNLDTLRSDQANYFAAPRRGHSAKPALFYEIVESMSPGPRLRLFARDEREGWESWGNEIPGEDAA